MRSFLLQGILFLSVILQTTALHAAGAVINIVYTGSLNAELEPCGCSPKTDFGGLARLAGYLEKHSDELSPYILIDAGNFTLKDNPQGRLKAEAMLRAFSIMGYDAVAFLENEKLFPEEFLLPHIRKLGLPALSGMTGLPETVSVSRGNTVFNISIDPGSPREGALNVLLTDRPADECRDIRGWDVIISSSGDILEEPLPSGKQIIVSGYPRGKKVGILNLEAGGSGVQPLFLHRWLTLGKDIKENADVRGVLDDYDSKVALLLSNPLDQPRGNTYLGVSGCAECHQPFVESWENTRHAGAFESLVKSGKASDPECLECHTVGFGEKGGFYTIETTPGLAGVQCEVCHGLDREHLTDYSRPMRQVTKAICLRCHTKTNSPGFNYYEYYEKIKH